MFLEIEQKVAVLSALGLQPQAMGEGEVEGGSAETQQQEAEVEEADVLSSKLELLKTSLVTFQILLQERQNQEHSHTHPGEKVHTHTHTHAHAGEQVHTHEDAKKNLSFVASKADSLSREHLTLVYLHYFALFSPTFAFYKMLSKLLSLQASAPRERPPKAELRRSASVQEMLSSSKNKLIRQSSLQQQQVQLSCIRSDTRSKDSSASLPITSR